MGYGQEIALADLIDMADARQTKFFAHKGKVVSQRKVADNEIRLRARVELNRIHGHYPNPRDTPPERRRAGADRSGVSTAWRPAIDGRHGNASGFEQWEQ